MLTRVAGYVRRQHTGLIAIAIASSGTAYAVATVGPEDIKSNAVLTRHIKAGQVKATELGPTNQRTRTFQIVGGPFGTGGGLVTCRHKRGRVVGFRIGFDSGSGPRSISALDVSERGVFAVGTDHDGGPSVMSITARCLKAK